MKKIIVNAGEIFCIPLFMPKDDWKLKTKLSNEDLDKDFAFGRVIETSSSVLVEIFKKIGSAKTSISEIEGSDILFSPLQIFWDGVIKKRWRIIGKKLEIISHHLPKKNSLFLYISLLLQVLRT